MNENERKEIEQEIEALFDSLSEEQQFAMKAASTFVNTIEAQSAQIKCRHETDDCCHMICYKGKQFCLQAIFLMQAEGGLFS